MKPLLRALVVIGGSSLLLGGDCMFGRPIVDETGRYYPSDGVISCTGTRCADLPSYELSLPPPLADSPCAQDLPTAELGVAVRAGPSLVGKRFTLASERSRDVHLSTIDVRDACVVLSGPVRLTVGPGSSLTNVTVMLGAVPRADSDAGVAQSSRGTPNLYLGHAQLDRVSVQAIHEGEPSGGAQLEFSTCSQCETRLDALTVTESQVQNSRLGAASLTVVGGAFDTVELAFEYGLLAGVLANDLRTAACNTLSLVGATIAGRASKIGPCNCGLASEGEMRDAGAPRDAGFREARDADSGSQIDAAPAQGGLFAGNAFEAGPLEAGATDAGSFDANTTDARPSDASAADAELPEADAADAGEVYVEVDVDDYGYDAGDLGPGVCNGVTVSQTTFFGGMVDGKVHAENSTFRSVLFARHAPTSLDMWNTKIELSVSCHQAIDIRLDKTSGIGCTSCDAEPTASACTLDKKPELTANKCESFSARLPACKAPLPLRMGPAIPMPPKLGF